MVEIKVSIIILFIVCINGTNGYKQVDFDDKYPMKDVTDDAFQKECLKEANRLRALHPIEPLQVTKEKYCRKLKENMRLQYSKIAVRANNEWTILVNHSNIEIAKTRVKRFINCEGASHTCNTSDAEMLIANQNLYVLPGLIKTTEKVLAIPALVNCTTVTQYWYNEITRYINDKGFSDPYYRSFSAHFTNLVWKDAYKTGCARYLNEFTGENVLICSYSSHKISPNLAYRSAFRDNVLPPFKIINKVVSMIP